MADKTISALPAATTPLAGTEVLPVVQGGDTEQVSVANLTAGRDVSVKKLNATDNVVIGTADKGITTGSDIPLGFGVNNSVTAMTIDTSNNVLINTTTQRGLFTVESASGNCRAVNVLVGTSIMDQFYFQGAPTGNISTNGVSASYNTTSDARLKHDITDAPEASVLIDQMRVRAFKWNMDNSKQRYGFIAQELLGVAPEAVYVPEDADQMMSVDYAKLVPMLVKEIQSLRTRVAQLEGK